MIKKQKKLIISFGIAAAVLIVAYFAIVMPIMNSMATEDEEVPELLEGDEIDLGGYVVEHLALEIDPFPRKPGVVFEPPADTEERSPFAVLKRLTDSPPKE